MSATPTAAPRAAGPAPPRVRPPAQSVPSLPPPTAWRASGLGPGAAAAALGLAVYLVFGKAFLNYDAFYALAWGQQLAEGAMPDYGGFRAPTPHPLETAAGALLSSLGSRAEEAMLAVVLLSLGVACVGLFRLGQTLAAWPVGLLAAAILVTRVPVLSYGLRGYVDLPALALLIWAAVLEARRPRRGAAVLILLTVCGLLRPEGWLFAGAYWLWCAPALDWGRRALLAGLAAGAPLLWLAADLAVTGDPFWSLRGTSDLAAQLERPTGLAALPEVVPYRLGEILRLPELLAAVAGFAIGWLWLRRAVALPIALAALNGLAFAAFAVAGLPLLGRYLFPTAAMLALFGALAALGWTRRDLAAGRRRRWQALGATVLLALLAFAPTQAARLGELRADLRARAAVQSDLRSLASGPAAASVLARCPRIYAPTHRPIPLLAYWAGRSPTDLASARVERPERRSALLVARSARVERLALVDPRDPEFGQPVPDLRAHARRLGMRAVAANRSWTLYASCGA